MCVVCVCVKQLLAFRQYDRECVIRNSQFAMGQSMAMRATRHCFVLSALSPLSPFPAPALLAYLTTLRAQPRNNRWASCLQGKGVCLCPFYILRSVIYLPYCLRIHFQRRVFVPITSFSIRPFRSLIFIPTPPSFRRRLSRKILAFLFGNSYF